MWQKTIAIQRVIELPLRDRFLRSDRALSLNVLYENIRNLLEISFHVSYNDDDAFPSDLWTLKNKPQSGELGWLNGEAVSSA